jgi:hypothetical protein
MEEIKEREKQEGCLYYVIVWAIICFVLKYGC